MVLVSTALAGIKRNTGLQPKLDSIPGGPDLQPYFKKYLDVGEYTMDTAVGLMNASSYFERK